MDIQQIEQILVKAKQLDALLSDLEPEVAIEVFGLVLSGRDNATIDAILSAARTKYQRRTVSEVFKHFIPTVTLKTLKSYRNGAKNWARHSLVASTDDGLRPLFNYKVQVQDQGQDQEKNPPLRVRITRKLTRCW
jgi:hypothetical protein